LGGMIVLHHTGALFERGTERMLYSRYSSDTKMRKVPLTFIPYYAWANRQASSMQVWNLLLPS